MNLTVVSVAKNDQGTLDLMLQSIFKFISSDTQILICDHGGNNILNHPNIHIIPNTPHIKRGSAAHGEGLNKIISHVKTPYTAIIESDVILTAHIPTNKTITSIKHIKKNNIYYHVCLLAAPTKILKKVDFRPGTDKTRSNRSYKIHEDVGWQLQHHIKPDILLDFVDCKTGNGVHFDHTFQSDEFHYQGKCIAAHHGRGSNIAGKRIREGFKHPQEQLQAWKKIAEKLVK